jgi:polyhydroxyalkanoate synthase
MTERGGEDQQGPNVAEFSKNMAKIAEQSQKLVADFLQNQSSTKTGSTGPTDPLNIGNAFMEMTAKMMAEPAKMVEAQMNLWQDYLALWQQSAAKMMGQETEPTIAPERGDRRFKAPEWNENQVFDFIKQSYLLTARWMQDTVKDVDGLDDKTAQKVDFYTRQFVDAMAPTNFVMTNPEVLRATVESNGENLVNGLNNLLGDMERGKGQLQISMTDMDAFQVGENVAVSPGKVVFQNDLIQLIQYAPTTEKVYKRPLLIAPPWINKFYILDLRPENSFIKWSVDQGYTVFVISWVNPDEKLSHKTFEDYLTDGILAAMDAVEQATGVKEMSTIGYCLGGTLMAAALAYLAAKNDKRIKACTFFTAQVDFSEPGELEIFIDEEQLQHLESVMAEKGYMEGSTMSSTFNMLRANDLIWSFVVNNYLLGKDPFPFDLLYWNSDATRMPADMHMYYLRNMYQKNLLIEPGALVMDGVPIDLTKIKTPVYIQSGKDDHIAPYGSVYKALHHYQGPTRFMLAGSGHIAGVVNPPAAKKYQYWVNETGKSYDDVDAWIADAEQHPGSWWGDWDSWLKKHSGPKVAARKPGSGKLKAIEDAPGSYVLVKS